MLLPIKLALIVFFGQAVDLIGKPAITRWVASIMALIAPSSFQKQQATLKKDILQTRADLRATSSQDEFAKWAKIRRKLDKQTVDMETLNSRIGEQQSTASTVVTAALFILTSVLPFVFTSMHSKSPVIYMPAGWFGPLDWFLSLPFAPSGALSCAVWTMAVRRTLNSVTVAVKELMPTRAPVDHAPISVLDASTPSRAKTQ